MNNNELLLYLVLVSTNCIIAYHLAAYGWLELSLARPMKQLPVLATVVGVGALICGGYLQRAGTLKVEVLTEANFWPATAYLLGPPTVLMLLVRYVLLPAGVPEYNRARLATQFWTIQNLKLGSILESEGELLKNFSRAQTALKYFDKAIAVQKRGTTTSLVERVISTDNLEPDYNRMYQSNCPVCGFHLGVPDSISGVTGHCTLCGSMITAKRVGSNIHIHAFGKKAKRVVVSTRNKLNVAIALCEKGLLLRMMNLFVDAEAAFHGAKSFVDEALSESPGQLEILRSKSLILFRAGELAQIRGDKERARAFYQECLAIDEETGCTEDSALVRDLMSKL